VAHEVPPIPPPPPPSPPPPPPPPQIEPLPPRVGESIMGIPPRTEWTLEIARRIAVSSRQDIVAELSALCPLSR
jgi:hypothetical protein